MNTLWLLKVLLCATLIDYAALLIWFALFAFAHRWMYRLHSRWFKLSLETFDALHFGGMTVFKIGIVLFNVVPMLALCIMR
jgi:hypothetical protein